MENFNNVPSQGKFGDSIAVINENFMLAQQEMEKLRQIYNSMSQSQPIPVITLPATGEAGKIYRLAGTNSYADYMYAESDLTTPIKMAEYDNAIDDEPTAGSNNLVKSRGVFLGDKISKETIYQSDLLRGGFGKLGNALQFTQGKYIPTNKNIGDTVNLEPQDAASSTYYAIFDCSKGDLFYLPKVYGGAGARLFCFIDANNIILSVAEENLKTDYDLLMAPAKSAKVIFHRTNTGNVYPVNKKPMITTGVIHASGNPIIDDTHYKVCPFLLVKNNETVSIVPQNRDSIIELSENGYMLYNLETGLVRSESSFSNIGLLDIFLMYHKDGVWSDGTPVNMLVSTNFWKVRKHIYDTYESINATFTENSVELSRCNGLIGNEIVLHKIEENGVETLQKFTFEANGFLVYNTVDKTARIVTSYTSITKDELVWLYYRSGQFIGGLLFNNYLSQRVLVSNTNDVVTKRAYQIANISWYAKNNVPTPSSPTGISVGTHKGIPYTSCMEVDKMVGYDVSLKTFMTAANNPYSLLYTEYLKTSQEHPNGISGYGFTYHGTRATIGGYMGIVCNIFGLLSLAYPIPYDTGNWNFLAEKGIFKKKSAQTAEYFQIGDIIIEPGHCNVITNIMYNEDYTLSSVEWSESVSPLPKKNIYTVTQANNRLQNNSGIIYRLAVPNSFYERSEFVAVANEVIGGTYQYNNDICTFAGDYAVFREGQKIFLNYNLETVGAWTGIQLYKDSVLINTLTINQLEHRIDLTGLNLEYGEYKARMTDGSNYSDYTYFQILQADVSVTYNGNDTMTVNFVSANGKPLFVRLCKMDGGPIGILSLTEDDIRKGSVTFNPVDLQQGYDIVSGGTYLKVYFESEYGRVTNHPILTNL